MWRVKMSYSIQLKLNSAMTVAQGLKLLQKVKDEPYVEGAKFVIEHDQKNAVSCPLPIKILPGNMPS